MYVGREVLLDVAPLLGRWECTIKAPLYTTNQGVVLRLGGQETLYDICQNY